MPVLHLLGKLRRFGESPDIVLFGKHIRHGVDDPRFGADDEHGLPVRRGIELAYAVFLDHHDMTVQTVFLRETVDDLLAGIGSEPEMSSDGSRISKRNVRSVLLNAMVPPSPFT